MLHPERRREAGRELVVRDCHHADRAVVRREAPHAQPAAGRQPRADAAPVRYYVLQAPAPPLLEDESDGALRELHPAHHRVAVESVEVGADLAAVGPQPPEPVIRDAV